MIMKTNYLPGKQVLRKTKIQELNHNDFSYYFSAAKREKNKLLIQQFVFVQSGISIWEKIYSIYVIQQEEKWGEDSYFW